MSRKAKRRKQKEEFILLDRPPAVRSESERDRLSKLLDQLDRESAGRRVG